jgi:hypothetical protein
VAVLRASRLPWGSARQLADRVADVVWAAGDCTAFSAKTGRFAAEQADVAGGGPSRRRLGHPSRNGSSIPCSGDGEALSVKDLSLSYDGFDPAEEGLREALTSTGNGYLCARGAAEWEDADDIHYPGTYLHGSITGRRRSSAACRCRTRISSTSRIGWCSSSGSTGRSPCGSTTSSFLAYRHALDIRDAVLLRELRFRDRNGRLTALRSRRFVSMADPHEAGIEWTLTPENWSGRVELVSAIDGRVTNSGVARYGQLVGRHVDPVSPRTFGPEVIALKVTTRQSDIYVSEGARTRVYEGGEAIDVERTLYQVDDYIQQSLAFDVREGEPVRVEKMAAFFTSRDRAISDTLASAGKAAQRSPCVRGGARPPSGGLGGPVARLRSSPTEGRARAVLAAFHISHVLQVCSRHTADLDAGVPGARSERRGVPGACVLG